ncbi:hypothetical protein RJ640_029505 [Escallonia rubra]|uniref:Protein COFACTOR ASSEMBLY OF COMPLEX C SUBUNIT B CCB4, chloroplastic n=1 Tax=Escallonia rubra TaxID=112253 RepID=A0AA88SM85_9ASTE|nr:hypothetical protein RJ640_029505 [Escallonia rubra]
MEAGTLLRPIPLNPPPLHRPPLRRRFHFFRRLIRASSNLQEGYRGPKPKRQLVADWVSKNDDAVRSLPIYVGGVSLLAVLFNRTVAGIALVADASRQVICPSINREISDVYYKCGASICRGERYSLEVFIRVTVAAILGHEIGNMFSSQSRADLLTLGLAVTNILAGLVWLSIRPKSISAVRPQGVECQRICSDLPEYVVSEVLWVWQTLSEVTCCRSLVIVYNSRFVLQIGFAAASSSNEREAVVVDPNKLMQGSLYRSVIKSESQSYLANLSLYPGKSELPFLPSNTQAVILQPLGDKGIAIIGGDTIRGFSTSDQAWITLVGEKLDATLTKFVNNLPQALQGRA